MYVCSRQATVTVLMMLIYHSYLWYPTPSGREATSKDISPPNSIEKPVFGPRPDTKITDFDFEAEIQCMPFKLNLGEGTNMTHIEQWLVHKSHL